MGYSCKHELSTIIMLSFLKKICHILHPYRPRDGHLSTIKPLSSVPKVAIVGRFDCNLNSAHDN